MLDDEISVKMTEQDFCTLRRMTFEMVMNYEDWHSSEHNEAVALFERVFHMTINEYIWNVKDRHAG